MQTEKFHRWVQKDIRVEQQASLNNLPMLDTTTTFLLFHTELTKSHAVTTKRMLYLFSSFKKYFFCVLGIYAYERFIKL